MADALTVRAARFPDDSVHTVDIGRVSAAAITPDRRHIVRVEAGRGVVWTPTEPSAPEVVWPVLKAQTVEQLAVSPDGTVSAATLRGLLHIAPDRAPELRKIGGGALCIAIDDQGHLAVGTGRGTVWLGDDHADFNGYQAHESRVEAIARRGSVILSGGADARVVWADLDAEAATRFVGHVAGISAVCLDRHGMGFSGSEDGAIKAWGGPERDLVWSARLPGGGPVHALAVQGDRLLATGRDRAIWALSRTHGTIEGAWIGHHRPVGGIFPVEGTRFCTWGRDRTLRTFATPPRATLPGYYGHSEGVRALLVEPDRLWTAARDGTVRQWLRPDGTPIGAPFRLTSAAIQVIARHSPTSLYFGTTDGTVGIVDDRGKVLERQKLHEGPVTCLARLSPDLLVSGGADGVLRTWDAHRLTPLAARTDHTDRVRCLTIVHDHVVTGSYDGTLARVAPLGGPVHARFEGHTRPVVGVAFTGTLVVSGALDGTLRTWQPDGTPLASATADPDGVVGVTSVGGGRVVTVGKSGQVALWDSVPLARVHALSLDVPLDGLAGGPPIDGQAPVCIGDQRGGITVLGAVVPSS